MSGASTNLDTHSTHLECPRCGHHFDPALLRVEHRQPEEITCSECGLASNIESLRKDASIPAWVVERRGGVLQRSVRAFRTALAGLRPYRFWSSIPMQLPIAWSGMLALLLALACVLHAAFAARRVTELDSTGLEYAVDAAWAIAAPVSTFHGSALVQGATAPDFPNGVTIDSLGRLAAMLPSAWTKGFHEALDPSALTFFGGRAIVGGVVPPAWFQPGSDRLGVTIGERHVLPYRDPRWAIVGNGISVQASLDPFATRPLERAGLACIVAFGPTIALLLLPMSLRRVKARPRHILRGMLYACIPATAITLLFAFRIENDYRVPYVNESDPWTQSIVAGSAVMFVWTHAYCARYIQLPHAKGVALAGATISMLCALMAMHFIELI
jgi:hypothetical protein